MNLDNKYIVVTSNLRKQPGVYCIYNLIDTCKYVGGSKNLQARKRQHFSDLKLNKHKNPRLQSAYNTYGVSSLLFYVLEYLPSGAFEDDIIDREQYWMDLLHPEYNINLVAGKYIGDYIRTEEARQKRSISMSKITNRKKRSPSKWKSGFPPNLGKVFGKETREKIKNAMTGSKNPNFGKPRPEETRRKISEGNSKTYKGLISPDGIVYKDIRYLQVFCKEHDLGLSSIVAVLRGRRKHHKGWKAL